MRHGVALHSRTFIVGVLAVIAAHDDFRSNAFLVQNNGAVHAIGKNLGQRTIGSHGRTQNNNSIGLKIRYFLCSVNIVFRRLQNPHVRAGNHQNHGKKAPAQNTPCAPKASSDFRFLRHSFSCSPFPIFHLARVLCPRIVAHLLPTCELFPCAAIAQRLPTCGLRSILLLPSHCPVRCLFPFFFVVHWLPNLQRISHSKVAHWLPSFSRT